ncbi:uncharacterized protein NPIL_117561 [Nephila pilipes]|uniref:Ig-like domain-containing protein n=1 Tax=Nephila pilipes TaxID=299642 RepID=A0A8X6NQC9_NEPPI|nr:uncharacterized protein NPIL_117561 [Nephila pilipes]
MPQRYAVEMHDEFVLKGNTAVLKCHVPGFVKDYVIVEAWIKEPMEKVDATSKSSTGDYAEEKNNDFTELDANVMN